MQLHHIGHLHGHAVMIDLRTVCSNVSKEERKDFLLRGPAIMPAEVVDVFMVPLTQLLRIDFRKTAPCEAVTLRIATGAPWTTKGNRLLVAPPRPWILSARSGCRAALRTYPWRSRLPTWTSLVGSSAPPVAVTGLLVILLTVFSTSICNSHLMQFSPTSLRWHKMAATWLRDCLLIRTSNAAVATAAAMLAMSSNFVKRQPGLDAPLVPY
jgi:hypothetical protein